MIYLFIIITKKKNYYNKFRNKVLLIFIYKIITQHKLSQKIIEINNLLN